MYTCVFVQTSNFEPSTSDYICRKIYKCYCYIGKKLMFYVVFYHVAISCLDLSFCDP